MLDGLAQARSFSIKYRDNINTVCNVSRHTRYQMHTLIRLIRCDLLFEQLSGYMPSKCLHEMRRPQRRVSLSQAPHLSEKPTRRVCIALPKLQKIMQTNGCDYDANHVVTWC